MKKLTTFLLLALSACLIFSCEQNSTEDVRPVNEVTPQIIAKLNAAGFNTTDFQVKVYQDNIIVERDIHLTMDQLDQMSSGIKMATEEHYHTDNMVSGTPRTINVYVNMAQKYKNATDIALARYNAENLNLTFQRVSSSSSADITIKASPWYYYWFGILGSAGFPTAGGDPHNEILMTTQYYNSVSNINGLATTIAHEMGHCIGFRHTDYMDRSYSCGGSTDNEGDGGVGANHISGTPTGPDAASWMLACGSPEGDRPFTANDKTALDAVY